MKLSLICPCYNEGKNIEMFYDTCVEVLDPVLHGDYEFVFVNDGSRDDTWEKLLGIYERSDKSLKLVNFSRNFGKEAAMYAGLCRCEGEYTVLIDTDLQQRPETVLEMVEFLDNNPSYDCVAAYQETRQESRLLTGCKSLFYKLINRMCEIDFHEGASDFRTFRRGVVDAILSIGECHRFMKGIFSWVGFNTYYIPYVASERHAGESTWSFGKLIKYAISGIVSFSTFPLKLASFVGSLMSMLSFGYMIVGVLQKLFWGLDIEGYATIIVLTLLIGGIQLLCLGILGEYISRIYIQGKGRPICVVKEFKEKKKK